LNGPDNYDARLLSLESPTPRARTYADRLSENAREVIWSLKPCARLISLRRTQKFSHLERCGLAAVGSVETD
jgi:hypothetical protein